MTSNNKYYSLDINIDTILKTRDLRLVILDCPYDTIQSKETQDLLSKIAALKITGYKKEYPYGALPVDTGDFVGVHLLLCEDVHGTLEPMMGFKSVSYDRCKIHHMTFPAFHLFPESGCEQHTKQVRKLLLQSEKNNEKIAYNGSWTLKQDFRSDTLLLSFCYDITLLLLVRYYTEYNFSHVLAGATVRFKVQAFKEFMGFEYLYEQGVKLPSFPCKPFFNEEVELMYLSKFSDQAQRVAEKYQRFWDERLTIAANVEKHQDIKRAA